MRGWRGIAGKFVPRGRATAPAILQCVRAAVLNRRAEGDLFPAEREGRVPRRRIEFLSSLVTIVNGQRDGRGRAAVTDRPNGFDSRRLQFRRIVR